MLGPESGCTVTGLTSPAPAGVDPVIYCGIADLEAGRRQCACSHMMKYVVPCHNSICGVAIAGLPAVDPA